MRGTTIIQLLALFVGFSDADTAPGKRQAGPVPGSLSSLDFKDGCRDLRFGKVLTPDMHLVNDEGDLKSYRRTRTISRLEARRFTRSTIAFTKTDSRLYSLRQKVL
jgi:hypothetical protein